MKVILISVFPVILSVTFSVRVRAKVIQLRILKTAMMQGGKRLILETLNLKHMILQSLA
jgi:hypothetical protein